MVLLPSSHIPGSLTITEIEISDICTDLLSSWIEDSIIVSENYLTPTAADECMHQQ